MLFPEEIRKLQRFLRNNGESDLAVDGVLGPRTLKVAFDLFREGPVGLSDETMWLLQTAAFASSRQTGITDGMGWRIPPVWIFYSNAPTDADWVRGLVPGSTIFWIHGRYPNGGAYKLRLRAGDTVLFLVGQAFIASGMLLADERLHFYDTRNRVRRPVRVLQRYDHPLSREAVEAELGGPLVRQGAVHPFPMQALDWFNRQPERSAMPELPYPPGVLETELSGSALARELYQAEAYGIRPDEATATAIGWTGEPWRPDVPIDPAAVKSPPEPTEETEPPEDESDAEPDASPATETQADATRGQDVDVQVPFVLDSPADAEDDLDRGPFALFLARRLHLIWCQVNGHAPDRWGKRTPAAPPESDTFIAHVDSPWGGGKSTFANFIARVLDPRGERLTANHFLRSSLAPTMPDEELAGVSLDEVFVPPYATDQAGAEKWPGARRAWIIARYNAWRDQFVQPPWWQIFLTLHAAGAHEVRRDAVAEIRAGRLGSGLKGLGRWLGVHFGRLTYQVWNSKLKAQVGIAALTVLLLLVLWWTGVARAVFSGSNPKTTADWITLAVAILGLGGASIATFFTVLTQSFSPDLDFSSEHKQIGVRDPIQRFRGMFERVLRATDRPILLIVDDIDRCEPATVVEIMRGFQTIIRSPRLFVLLLGDRAWIEGAHDVYHKDLLALEGGEAKLGALYVRKVIQLSFRLPVMKAEARRRFARRVLGEREESSTERVTSELKQVERQTREIASGSGSIGAKEAAISEVIKQAAQSFAALPEAQRIVATAAASEIAETQVVVAAGADTAQQREVFNAVTQLIDCLPNNPRQIKRIFMAFATYEQVGRRLFGYRLTATGDDGELRARRWRQLAMWVTLAVEWPETWRAVARRPELLDAAYGPKAKRSAREGAIMKGLTDAQKPALAAVLRRLRNDPSLVALLSGEGIAGLSSEAQAFAHTAMEPAAVHEFNRIIWEPDFQLQANLAG